MVKKVASKIFLVVMSLLLALSGFVGGCRTTKNSGKGKHIDSTRSEPLYGPRSYHQDNDTSEYRRSNEPMTPHYGPRSVF